MPIGNHTLPTETMSNCTDGMLYCFSQWASDVTTGAFWAMAMISFTVVIFLATLRFGSNRAFGFGGLVCLLGGVWLSILTLIPWWLGSIFILVGTAGFAVMLISEKK
jgi:hypothetical protein